MKNWLWKKEGSLRYNLTKVEKNEIEKYKEFLRDYRENRQIWRQMKEIQH